MDGDVRDIFEVEKLLADSVPQPLTKDAILHPQKVTRPVSVVLLRAVTGAHDYTYRRSHVRSPFPLLTYALTTTVHDRVCCVRRYAINMHCVTNNHLSAGTYTILCPAIDTCIHVIG